MAGRKANDPDERTYPGRIAQKLRQLRKEHGWSVRELCDKLEGLAHERVLVLPDAWRCYERGKDAKGANLPPDYYPAIAEVFGFETVPGWLPPH
jgi:transcriptional regulator with XRE-family HTH domain